MFITRSGAKDLIDGSIIPGNTAVQQLYCEDGYSAILWRNSVYVVNDYVLFKPAASVVPKTKQPSGEKLFLAISSMMFYLLLWFLTRANGYDFFLVFYMLVITLVCSVIGFPFLE